MAVLKPGNAQGQTPSVSNKPPGTLHTRTIDAVRGSTACRIPPGSSRAKAADAAWTMLQPHCVLLIAEIATFREGPLYTLDGSHSGGHYWRGHPLSPDDEAVNMARSS